MLQDIQRGVQTEIVAICGAVVATGERLGIETPLNGRLLVLVQQAETGQQSPSTLDDIL
jgi:ketopantoate reductase